MLKYLKVHKNVNIFGSDFEFCTISLLVMLFQDGQNELFSISHKFKNRLTPLGAVLRICDILVRIRIRTSD
jgi:hypothetical protein